MPTKPKVEKKLFDRNRVIAGLVIFVVLITIPLWQNLGKTVAAPTPSLDTPAIKQLAAKDKKVRHAHGVDAGQPYADAG